jgi:hypothetical protein
MDEIKDQRFRPERPLPMNSKGTSRLNRRTASKASAPCGRRFKRTALPRRSVRAIRLRQILKLAMTCKRWEAL